MSTLPAGTLCRYKKLPTQTTKISEGGTRYHLQTSADMVACLTMVLTVPGGQSAWLNNLVSSITLMLGEKVIDKIAYKDMDTAFEFLGQFHGRPVHKLGARLHVPVMLGPFHTEDPLYLLDTQVSVILTPHEETPPFEVEFWARCFVLPNKVMKPPQAARPMFRVLFKDGLMATRGETIVQLRLHSPLHTVCVWGVDYDAVKRVSFRLGNDVLFEGPVDILEVRQGLLGFKPEPLCLVSEDSGFRSLMSLQRLPEGAEEYLTIELHTTEDAPEEYEVSVLVLSGNLLSYDNTAYCRHSLLHRATNTTLSA